MYLILSMFRTRYTRVYLKNTIECIKLDKLIRTNYQQFQKFFCKGDIKSIPHHHSNERNELAGVRHAYYIAY